jgi:hypothetical protein
MKTFASSGLSDDQVKRVVKNPVPWGAKISGGQFRERVAADLKG